ncbi:MAG: hypothetical protein K2Q01_05375, partial [Rickettsiales bacterium]|nr:hypothetical protein [Rickettsiales bacterium]
GQARLKHDHEQAQHQIRQEEVSRAAGRAYELEHSMGQGKEFAPQIEQERAMAQAQLPQR